MRNENDLLRGFLENPFRILEVKPSDSRQTIISRAEERSFYLDPTQCTMAQNALLQPEKRLAAELDWFLTEPEDVLSSISSSMEARTPLYITVNSRLSGLNAAIYAFALKPEMDAQTLREQIILLDRKISAVNPDETARTINAGRASARMLEVSPDDLRDALIKKRKALAKLIAGDLDLLSEDEMVALATALGEFVTAQENADALLISDVLDEYELRIQGKLDALTNEINGKIERIRALTDVQQIEASVDPLISTVEQWDRYAQPLQLRAYANGIGHANSERMANSLRKLAVDLHNEKHATNASYRITQAMKTIFAELRVVSEQVERDSEQLEALLKEHGAVGQIAERINRFQTEWRTEQMAFNAPQISAFLSEVREIKHTIESSDLDDESRNKLLEVLGLIARSYAVNLSNKHRDTNNAGQIVRNLRSEFSGIPSVSAKLEEDYKALEGINRMKQAAVERAQTKSREGQSGAKLLVILGFFLLIALIGGISNSCDSSTGRSSGYPGSYSSGTGTKSGGSGGSSTISSVHKKVKMLVPMYEINETKNGFSRTVGYVCKCYDDEGEDYYAYFLSSVYDSFARKTADSSNETTNNLGIIIPDKTWELSGTYMPSELICNGLSEKVGMTILDVSSTNPADP